MTVDLRRHDLVWLAPGAAWTPNVDALARWIAAGRPLVVRRRDGSLAPDDVPLGVALPLAEGRLRIATVVDWKAIVRSTRPLSIDAVIESAPPVRRAALADLDRLGAALDTPFSVYGSHAWQAICGEPCVTPDSDVDLLWDARDTAHLARVVEALIDWERGHGLRADGEVRFADGAAVAWREFVGRPARVLVKRDDGVAMERSPLAAA
jgi:phosphoribosyl-dephospho-CoA transferase